MAEETTAWRVLQQRPVPEGRERIYLLQETRINDGKEEHQICFSSEQPGHKKEATTWGFHSVPTAYQAADVFAEYLRLYENQTLKCVECGKELPRKEMHGVQTLRCEECATAHYPF